MSLRKLFLLIVSMFLFVNTFSQIKFGTNGLGLTLKNKLIIRGNYSVYVTEKKKLQTEIQYNKKVFKENLNNVYLGLGLGFKWVNLKNYGNGFVAPDYRTQYLYVPFGFEYFPFENDNFSFQLETGLSFEITKYELDPNRKLEFYFYPRGIIELNYYFSKRNKKYR